MDIQTFFKLPVQYTVADACVCGGHFQEARSQARFHSARRTTTHDFSTQTAPIRALLGQLHALCAPGMLLFRAASPLRRILLFPEQLALICLTGGFEAALDKRVDKRQG